VLPLDTRTGRIDEQVWQRWLDWDPARMAGRYSTQLAGGGAGLNVLCR
jgi:hypothetical protein